MWFPHGFPITYIHWLLFGGWDSSAGDDYQPLTLDLAMQRWLGAGGVRRVCSGQLTLVLC
jgi:hypothetical protein